MTTTSSQPAAGDGSAFSRSPAWWREPIMWLVLGGPAAVVVAGVATFVIAASQPDPVIAEDYYRRGLEINKTLRGDAPSPAALEPAMKARNHAATPTSDVPVR